MNLNIFSDLRKPGLVPVKSLSPSTNINSVLEKNQIYIMSNRMRSLHMHKRCYVGTRAIFTYRLVPRIQTLLGGNIAKYF